VPIELKYEKITEDDIPVYEKCSFVKINEEDAPEHPGTSFIYQKAIGSR
jgi:hypothetical protein